MLMQGSDKENSLLSENTELLSHGPFTAVSQTNTVLFYVCHHVEKTGVYWAVESISHSEALGQSFTSLSLTFLHL